MTGFVFICVLSFIVLFTMFLIFFVLKDERHRLMEELAEEKSKTEFYKKLEKIESEEKKDAEKDKEELKKKSGRDRFDAACNIMQNDRSSD